MFIFLFCVFFNDLMIKLSFSNLLLSHVKTSSGLLLLLSVLRFFVVISCFVIVNKRIIYVPFYHLFIRCVVGEGGGWSDTAES